MLVCRVFDTVRIMVWYLKHLVQRLRLLTSMELHICRVVQVCTTASSFVPFLRLKWYGVSERIRNNKPAHTRSSGSLPPRSGTQGAHLTCCHWCWVHLCCTTVSYLLESMVRHDAFGESAVAALLIECPCWRCLKPALDHAFVAGSKSR